MTPEVTRTLRRLMEYEAARKAPPEGFPALPDLLAGRYTDPRFFELEKHHIWRKSWLFAAHLDEVPEPGCFRLWENAGQPVLIVHAEDGAINVPMYLRRVAALAGVSLDVKKGEIHSIIGPNGAGKTVLMNCINGLYRPQKGRVYFKGKDITDVKPHGRASMGLSRTLQKIELFGGMTVLDNIRLGRPIHLNSGIVSGSI